MSEERKAFCRYCGGEIRIVICDDEGNMHDAEYLKHPYSGVGYMLAHDLSDVPDGVECPICTFDDETTSIGTWIYDTAEEAYAAATRRPENRPLTREQIRQLEYCDAVFSADEYGHITVWSGEEVKLYVSKCVNWQFKQFFAFKPTPEDIEAARKEHKA